MTIGVIGKKCGMSRVFTEDGSSIPVSVIAVVNNRVAQVKTEERDGYNAVQIAYGTQLPQRLNKPLQGHLAKAGIEPAAGLKEFRVSADDLAKLTVATDIKVDQFSVGQKVDVTGVTKGKGFAGVIKRHNFSMQDATHGNSISHRAPGSTGQCQTPGRVFKGKKMAGQMGNVQCTVQGLEVVKVDEARQLILIKGAVPGAPGGYIVVNRTVKSREEA